MAKGEERWDADAVVVAVADIQAFAVDDLEVLARPVVVGRRVFEATGEGALFITCQRSDELLIDPRRAGLTGSFPLGFFRPNRTSARALPASCPWYHA